MRRRTYLSSVLGALASSAGCSGKNSTGEGSPTQSQSGLSVDSVSVVEYKPKEYEDRPKVAGALEATIKNSGSQPITINSFRISGDVPRPHDETQTGRFTIPSQDTINKVEIKAGESQRLRMRHEPLYYVDLSSEGGRTQEELDSSTCMGETRNATLHFGTENKGSVKRDIELRFSGDSVEFDEMAPDYGCTNITAVAGSS